MPPAASSSFQRPSFISASDGAAGSLSAFRVAGSCLLVAMFALVQNRSLGYIAGWGVDGWVPRFIGVGDRRLVRQLIGFGLVDGRIRRPDRRRHRRFLARFTGIGCHQGLHSHVRTTVGTSEGSLLFVPVERCRGPGAVMTEKGCKHRAEPPARLGVPNLGHRRPNANWTSKEG
jgi:hypothetical protein